MKHILEELQERGLIDQISNEKALRKVLKKPTVLYCGFDATAESLQIGNLFPLLTLLRFQYFGHRPIVLIGKGTSLIGDPSGKRTERVLQDKEMVEFYCGKIKEQCQKILGEKIKVLTNDLWLTKWSLIDFLREIGKHFSLGYMLAKESVKSRLASGISFTEFSYMLLQAYDFLYLFQKFNCQLQIGGSDQWGNITAGIDLIRKITKKEAYGLTLPLVTKADGTKFGKTEAGSIWLDPLKTSPYQFYQFLINVDDRDVVKLLKYYTFLSLEEIKSLEKATQLKPETREAQKVLAKELTSLVHGKEVVQKVEKISQALFFGEIENLPFEELKEAFHWLPSTSLSFPKIALIDLLISVRAASSKREARELIEGKAIKINGRLITKKEKIITKKDFLKGKFLIIKKGKRNYYLVYCSK